MKKEIEESYESTELFLEMFLESPKKVQQLLMLPLTQRCFYPEVWNNEAIQSPIEKIFITAFELYCEYFKNEKIFLFSQFEVKCKEKKYIVDFEFHSDDYLEHLLLGDKIKNNKFKLAIECDGYAFHQKTKEQVQRDNEREFDLKMEGYDVLRFSGTQIYNNPVKCAEDTYNYIMKHIEEE